MQDEYIADKIRRAGKAVCILASIMTIGLYRSRVGQGRIFRYGIIGY